MISKWRDLPYDPILGLGVLDIHTDFIESPELVRDRILYAVDVFGDPGADPRLPGLRPADAELGRRLREAPQHGRGHAPRRGVAEPRPRRLHELLVTDCYKEWEVGELIELAAESAILICGRRDGVRVFLEPCGPLSSEESAEQRRQRKRPTPFSRRAS